MQNVHFKKRNGENAILFDDFRRVDIEDASCMLFYSTLLLSSI